MRGGQLHVVMPLYERGSLARRVAERGAGLRAEEVAVQVLGGLAELHERGVVHRDVRPGNVLVEEGGGAVVADYGLATVAERMGAPVRERACVWEHGCGTAHVSERAADGCVCTCDPQPSGRGGAGRAGAGSAPYLRPRSGIRSWGRRRRRRTRTRRRRRCVSRLWGRRCSGRRACRRSWRT